VIFEQFYLGCLAHASYLIGSDGVAAVVDPQRDVEIYTKTAAERGLRIAHVIETHLHADFVSGHQELAGRTGATIYLGAGSGATFPHRAVRDGDSIELGAVRLEFLQTPGHTPESVSVVIHEGGERVGVLTGDTLFIGDVGRPDLAESYSPQELAGMLYDSLHRKILALPDAVAVYPAHGAGSMCGRNIGSDRSSTIGRERASNYALQPMARERFVEIMTQDLPPRPEYFARDVDVNRHGAPALDALPPLPCLVQVPESAVVLDTRPAAVYAAGHVPGSLQIGLGGQFAAWAGALIGLDRDVVLVCEDDVEEARLRLARVGIDRVVGYLDLHAGHPLVPMQQIEVQELKRRKDEFCIVDVRRKSEWEAGHIEGAVLMPLDELRTSCEKLDRSRKLAVHCKGGFRSAIACSLLLSTGFPHVFNILGGYDAWVAS
jgi:hydroxyacylglutathione hydrolase